MKLKKHILLLLVAFSLIGVVQAAKQDIFYNVPFHNVEIKAASKIYVEYYFDPHSQVLVCTSEQADHAITSVEWAYKDATRKLDLPVTLNDDKSVEGYLADPAGKLIITNDFYNADNESGSIFVTCEYQKSVLKKDHRRF